MVDMSTPVMPSEMVVIHSVVGGLGVPQSRICRPAVRWWCRGVRHETSSGLIAARERYAEQSSPEARRVGTQRINAAAVTALARRAREAATETLPKTQNLALAASATSPS
jgi:hypothetical protein